MTTNACDFCGLPVATARRPAVERTPQPVYCCFGCEFAAEVTQGESDAGPGQSLLIRVGLAAFCTMNVLAFTMVLWSRDVYPATDEVRAVVLVDVLRYLGLLFSLPVWFLLGQPLLLSSLRRFTRGAAATDLLVCAGVIAALAFSAISTWRGTGAVYYEVACIILVFISLGRWLEAQGKLKATEALDELARLLPQTVRLLRNGAEEVVSLAEVGIGDVLVFRPGECIAVDGQIVRGHAAVDQSLLTGESWPVERQAGDFVAAGAFNLDGTLEVRATSTASEGSLGRLLTGLREAREHQGTYERLAEQVARWFLPATFVLAMGTWIWWTFQSGWMQGILSGMAVLLIACPCALGLATPLAVWTALGVAARRQVLFRSGEALEKLASIRVLAWDKTGTLTTDSPTVASMIWASDTDSQRWLPLFIELARHSNHPYSQALQAAFKGIPVAGVLAGQVREVAGMGLQTDSETQPSLCLGNESMATRVGLHWPARLRAACRQLKNEGQPIVLGGADGVVRCLFVIQEVMRAGAAESLKGLDALGIHQVVLTGDHGHRAARLVAALQSPADEVVPFGPSSTSPHAPTDGDTLPLSYQAELVPAQKVAALKRLRAEYGPVAMIGDGVNDAWALAASDLGITLKSGADISRDTAGVCLISEKLTDLPWAVAYARFTVQIIRQNLWWAFGYNAVGMALAALGFLNPSLAAVLMAGSSLFVIANSSRLLQSTSATKAVPSSIGRLATSMPVALTSRPGATVATPGHFTVMRTNAVQTVGVPHSS